MLRTANVLLHGGKVVGIPQSRMKGSCWGSTGLFLVTQVRIQYIDVALLSTGQHRSSSSRL